MLPPDSLNRVSGAQLFSDSAERVVAYLRAHTPLTDWSVSRVTDGEQIHIHVQRDNLLAVGDRVDWQESFCSRMERGAAHVVRDAKLDADYSDLAAADRVRAYAGFTLGDDQGDMFGVLCGVRSQPLRDYEVIDEQLVQLLSKLLSAQLGLARTIDRDDRRIQLAEALAERDALTGALNRRGWDRLIADAQQRLESFGDPVAVAVVDLDGLKKVNDTAGHAAGDALIRRAAEALQSVSSESSHVARYGGDEFMILANGVVPSKADQYFEVFSAALSQSGVRASIGYAAAEPGLCSVEEAISSADGVMYAQKRLSYREAI